MVYPQVKAFILDHQPAKVVIEKPTEVVAAKKVPVKRIATSKKAGSKN